MEKTIASNIIDPTKRFSSRVKDYVKYRPGYPAQIVSFLETELGLSSSHVVADIGSGTGLLTKLFLDHGNPVYGIEPNTEMRKAGEKFLASYKNLVSIDGTAENTAMNSGCIDIVTAGQAFHWFDHKKCRSEFLRILKPDGHVIIIWNDRKDLTPLGDGYEGLLKKYGTDYEVVSAKYRCETDSIQEFFNDGWFKLKEFENAQILDLASFQGRLMSTSYAPTPGQSNYEPMISSLHTMFERYQKNGVVKMEYDTKLYYGQLAKRQK